jgi:hypothetical protein
MTQPCDPTIGLTQQCALCRDAKQTCSLISAPASSGKGLQQRSVHTQVAFPSRFTLSIVPPLIHQEEPDLQAADDSIQTEGFPGFDQEDIPALAFMATLLKRNQVLNICEGVIAALLLISTKDHASSFEVSERVLYIVCCLSNAVCLRCALALLHGSCMYPGVATVLL